MIPRRRELAGHGKGIAQKSLIVAALAKQHVKHQRPCIIGDLDDGRVPAA